MAQMDGSIQVVYGGETLHLLAERAIYWPARKSLIVADVHLGKATAFRKAGLPVPTGASEKDLGRIGTLLQATEATRLIILGDLIHARTSHDESLFAGVCAWRASHAEVSMLLVRGNHDRRAGKIPVEWKMEEVEEPAQEAPLIFCHAPREDLSRPVLCGHVHPVFSIRDFDRSMIRIPCFVFDAACCAILPAFGTFTGGHAMQVAPGREIYITSGKRVVKVREKPE